MELEEFIKSIESLDFNDVIKRESKEYLTKGYRSVSYHDKDDDKKFITNGMKRFITKDDKTIFLLEAINYLNENLVEVDKKIGNDVVEPSFGSNSYIYELERYQDHQELKEKKPKLQAQIFYAVRELEKLGLKNLDKNAFSNAQVHDLTRKINALLIKIDELAVGQEVIFNFIGEFKEDLNEMKDEFPLGKKRWYQRFSGVVVSYFGHKGADAFYDLIKPDIMKIIKEIPIDKFLH
ncbi:MAG TPA: hypothetical protein VNW95_06845 [Mucilaginibacter sp.]|jgi:hypothetical protein|nr:hypothetical protein [Mucilaginibacter sp.]